MSIHGQLLAALGDLRGTGAADRLCVACVDLLPVDAAAISLVFDGRNAATLGVSDAAARRYDELQFTLGEGPCLDSVSRRAPVVVEDLAAPEETRWPAYVQALLAFRIRAVVALPVVVAGEYVGALDLFRAERGLDDADLVAGALVAAELAEMPVLDLLGSDLQATIEDPDSDAWAVLNSLSRAEVSQATGMLVADLEIAPADALIRIRAYAYAHDRSATEVSRDILERRLTLEDE